MSRLGFRQMEVRLKIEAIRAEECDRAKSEDFYQNLEYKQYLINNTKLLSFRKALDEVEVLNKAH